MSPTSIVLAVPSGAVREIHYDSWAGSDHPDRILLEGATEVERGRVIRATAETLIIDFPRSAGVASRFDEGRELASAVNVGASSESELEERIKRELLDELRSLERSAVVTGRVSRNGAPLADCRVRLQPVYRKAEITPHELEMLEESVARTDADGRFSFRQVPPGSYDVLVFAPEVEGWIRRLDGEADVIARAGLTAETSEIDIGHGRVMK